MTAFLVAWTLIVSPHSGFGDKWAIWPANLAASIIVIWHMALSVRYPGWRSALVAAAHILLVAPVWLVCVMSISKDGL